MNLHLTPKSPQSANLPAYQGQETKRSISSLRCIVFGSTQTLTEPERLGSRPCCHFNDVITFGAKSNGRGRKRLGTSLCKPVAGSLPAPTRANLAEVQGNCTVIPVICERFDALCLPWNHGAISVKFVTVTLNKAIFNARRKPVCCAILTGTEVL